MIAEFILAGADTMSEGESVSVRPSPAGQSGGLHGNDAALTAFLAAIGSVLVRPPIYHQFPGAIETGHAASIWAWMARDIAQSEAARLADAIASGADGENALDLLGPEILDKLKRNAQAEESDSELERRNTIQMGGEDVRKRLAHVIMALRRKSLLGQATKFGSTVGTMRDEGALASAMQTITISNPVTRALWMQAMVGYMSNPSRAMAAAVSLAGGPDEARITSAGYAPLVDALLSHAQAQIGELDSRPGVFSDVDFSCKAIDRFHRLMRAINYNLEVERKSHWGTIINDLTSRMSERLERPLREIAGTVTQALQRPREGADTVDPDRVFGALGGMYLLAVIRNSRDSLAVNALLDPAWTDTGQAIEVLVTRALDIFRANPEDEVNKVRLEAGIKLAEIRFNAEYAGVLRRAVSGASKRTAQS